MRFFTGGGEHYAAKTNLSLSSVVSGLRIGPICKVGTCVVSKRRCETNLISVITQKTTKVRKTAVETYDLKFKLVTCNNQFFAHLITSFCTSNNQFSFICNEILISRRGRHRFICGKYWVWIPIRYVLFSLFFYFTQFFKVRIMSAANTSCQVNDCVLLLLMQRVSTLCPRRPQGVFFRKHPIDYQFLHP